MRSYLVLALVTAALLPFEAWCQFGAEISSPRPINSDSQTDSGDDYLPEIATDGAGTWVATWVKADTRDSFVSRSIDNGVNWSAPLVLSDGHNSPFQHRPFVATDRSGTWVIVFSAGNYPGSGPDLDILYCRSVDNGATWSPPTFLNASATVDGNLFDSSPVVATDRQGTWIAAWQQDLLVSPHDAIAFAKSVDNGATWTDLGLLPALEGRAWVPGLGADSLGNWVVSWIEDTSIVRVSRSTDLGESWTTPQTLGTTDFSGPTSEFVPVGDDAGNWVVTWWGYGVYRNEIFASTSTDGGQSWSSHLVSGGSSGHWNHNPRVATNGDGDWLAVWWNSDGQGISLSRDVGVTWADPSALLYDDPVIASDTFGKWIVAGSAPFTTSDEEIMFSSVGICENTRDPYGVLLFPERCTRDAGGVVKGTYDSKVLSIAVGVHDSFYLSSDGHHFSPLIVDDAVRIEGLGIGLGPYLPRNWVPPYSVGVPISSNLIPLPAHEVGDFFPEGQSTLFFELVDTQSEIYGNTDVYLVRDCGLWMDGSAPTAINWLSHDDEIAGTPREFEIRFGLLSHLRTDADFSRASCLGHFLDTPAIDTLSEPPSGDGYYYLARGLSSCVLQGYGDSSLAPDLRDPLDTLPTCP
jgi:hypothetical protein